jgi:hypothetical protein
MDCFDCRWPRRIRDLEVGGEKWCEAVQDWRCGVLDARRTEASKPGDNPRSAQDRRHCRRSPRVHDPNLQTLHLSQLAQPSMRRADFSGREDRKQSVGTSLALGSVQGSFDIFVGT